MSGTTTISPKSLDELSKKKETPKEVKSKDTSVPIHAEAENLDEAKVVKFIFPIAPCSIRLRGHARKIILPDGTYRTSDESEISQLRAKAKKGLCQEYTAAPKRSDYNTPVQSTAQLAAEQHKAS